VTFKKFWEKNGNYWSQRRTPYNIFARLWWCNNCQNRCYFTTLLRTDMGQDLFSPKQINKQHYALMLYVLSMDDTVFSVLTVSY